MATLPQQAQGPGPTAQALPSYLSYSAVATNVVQYTSTLTEVVYDPQGQFAPYQTINTIQGTTTSIDYSIVNVPLLYTGPFPAPDLGTLYTTPGQSRPSPTRATSTPRASSATAAPTSAPTNSANSVTAESAPSSTAAPTISTATPTTLPSGTIPTSTSRTATPTTVPSSTLSSVSTATPTTAPTSTTSSTTGSSPSSASSGTTSNQPSATVAGGPNPKVRTASGLSGGQIVGIVLGAFFALLLLLLLLLCCFRRRRKRHREAAVLAAATGGRTSAGGPRTGGGPRGNYTALGAGAGAAGLGAAGAAAAGRRGSRGSDDWEEDQLTGSGGGAGFFVVGGRRLGPDRRASIASRRSRGSAGTGPSFSAANAAPSSASKGAKASGFGALAAAGAGLLGSAFGRSGNKSGTQVDQEEEQPLSDEDTGYGSMAERRGLMPFHDSPNSGYGSGSEMREASSRILGPLAAPTAAAAYGAQQSRHGGQARDTGSPQRLQNLGALGAADASPPTSSALSGSGGSSSGYGSGSHATRGTPSSHTRRADGAANVSSSNSTGGFTTSGSGTSLPPPPRAPRNSPQSLASTYGNVEASTATSSPPTATASGGQDPRFSADTTDSAASATGGLNPALLGAGALGGLGALAAGHRESDGSTFSRHRSGLSTDVRDSHPSELSAEELSHLRSTDPERYSRFISTGSNLLGPDYQPSPELDPENKELGAHAEATSVSMGTLGSGPTAFQRTRLPTIRSVGEFGEKSETSAIVSQSTGNRTASSQPYSSLSAVTGPSGSLGTASTGSRRVFSPLPMYEQHQLQPGESLPDYALHDQPAAPRRLSEGEQIQSPISEGQGFVTPPDSPRNLLGGAVGTRSGEPSSSEVQRYADAGDDDVGNAANQGDDNDRHGAELAEGGVASAGILGGVAAGWRRLTMGQYAWVPGASSSRGHQASSFRDSSGDLEDPEGRTSHDHGQRVSEDSSRLVHQRRASRLDTSDAGFAPDVRSERASVYGPSALGHNTSRSSPIAHLSSKEASGSSGEQAKSHGGDALGGAALAAGASARQRSHPSLSSQHSSARSRGGGYAASHSNSSVSGRRAASDSTGLDSLSAVAQLSSRSTGSASSRSGNRSSSRGGRSGGISEVSFGSGASTGAASYSPSGVLSRGNTTSTRGFQESSAPTGSATYYPSRRSGEASSLMTDAAEAGGSDLDLNSSRATQGGSSSQEKRKRPRSSSVDGLSRLDSLREVREASDPFGDVGSIPEDPPSAPPVGGHYPSESLGAAVSRSVARDLRHQQQSSLGEGASESAHQTQTLPQHSRIRSLQPGTAAPAPTALAPSLSTPSLHSSSRAELTSAAPQSALPPSSSSGVSGFPASASWRPSPRVASAAQRAAEAQAALLQNQPGERHGFGGATPPRSQAASPSGGRPGASYNWADLDTTFRAPDHTQPNADLENAEGGPSATQDPDTSNKSFEWPKFLRF